MRPGTEPGSYTYSPGADGSYVLRIHLHAGDFDVGGDAPRPAAPPHSTGAP